MKMKLMILLGIIASLVGCQSPGNEGVGFENDTIVSFHLSEGGGMNRFGGFGYSISETKDGKVHFLFDSRLPTEKEFYLDDHSVFDSLQQIILKHKMYTYQGHYDPPFDITDGGSWSLSVYYKSRKSISAGGYMAGPEGYGEAFRDIMNCLDHWKNMPMGVKDVVSFRYEYGQERYTIERGEDHAVLTYDNEETGEHQTLERGLDILEDLRIVFNIYSLKMNGTRGETKPDCTPWMYEITYLNGDHFFYESADCGFLCGYTNALQTFFSNWMGENPEMIYRRF